MRGRSRVIEPSDDWTHVEDVVGGRQVWGVFCKEGRKGWSHVRVCRRKPGAGRGNLWLAWNGTRFARSHEHGWLVENRPDVLSAAEKAMEAFTARGGDVASEYL